MSVLNDYSWSEVILKILNIIIGVFISLKLYSMDQQRKPLFEGKTYEGSSSIGHVLTWSVQKCPSEKRVII